MLTGDRHSDLAAEGLALKITTKPARPITH